MTYGGGLERKRHCNDPDVHLKSEMNELKLRHIINLL